MGLKKGCLSNFKGKKHSLDSLKKIKEARALQTNAGLKKGCISNFKGRKHSQDTLNLLREKAKKQVNRKGPRGKPWSPVRRKAQEERNRLGLKPKRRKIITSVIKNGREYSPFWHDIRKIVYKRDFYKCQECGIHCRMKGKVKIQCHHIDYDIANNDLSNLITLCASCHGKTNFKRVDWIKYFSENKERN